MVKPERVQISRKKGARLPDNTIVVARPSKWGNPTHISNTVSASDAVTAYVEHLADHPDLADDARRELAGKNLACWCRIGAPCHGDLLLLIANPL